MNKKGFTLVELMAVIIILGIIGLIGVSAMGSVRRNINVKTTKEKLNGIISVSKTYADEHKNLFSNGEMVIKIQKLLDDSYYKSEEEKNGKVVVLNDVTGEELNDIEIKVYRKNNRTLACIVKNETLLSDITINAYCS